MTRLTATDTSRWLVPAVFGALPTVGLVAGPSYASLIFGLGLVQLAVFVGERRRLPVIDRPLALLALAFALLCWASILWSIEPRHSRQIALQVTAVFAGALVFLAGPRPAGDAVDRLFRVLLLATLCGAILFVGDYALGFRLQRLIMGYERYQVLTKYNRGIDYLAIIAWPQFGYAALRRRWWDVGLLGVALAVIVGIGASLAGQVGLLLGLCVLVCALWRARLTATVLAVGLALGVATMPLTLHEIAAQRDVLASHLKQSGFSRLEIWNHMTARVMDRPLLGWGIATAGKTPITQDEVGHYGMDDTYPHDQWLQLWVETGAVGAAFGVAFALLVLRRIGRLTPPVQPFACAAFAAAALIATVNFEVTTDSWWAVLCAGGYLLGALDSRTRDFAIRMTSS